MVASSGDAFDGTGHRVSCAAAPGARRSPPGPSGVVGPGGDREVPRGGGRCEDVPKTSGSLVEARPMATVGFLGITLSRAVR